MKWIFVLLICISCVKENLNPVDALKSFVESRMEAVVTRDFVLKRVTGKMKQSLENITDEEFAKFADLRNVKKNSFKILSKSCQEKVCFITYTVSYRTEVDDKTVFTSEVKKIAEVVQEQGQWLISDVSNIKTYHEALEPISP
jgi:hypothetical protein